MKYISRCAWPGLAALLTVAVSLSALTAAQARAQQGIPEFIPSSPWVVGQNNLSDVRGLQGVKLPCMMVNQFDNGFVVRFAGGGQRLTAMAVDFRQDIFRQGTRYSAAVYTDAGYRGAVKGSAFNASTLVFNLRDETGFYNALRQGRSLGLSIGPNDMRFSLSNIQQGIERLESCYGGNASVDARQAAAAASAMAPAPSFNQLPTSLAEIQADSSGQEVYMKRTDKPQGADNRMGSTAGRTWRASAGESLYGVLARWAGEAGVDLQWQAAGGGGQVAQDFQQISTFEEAVAALLAENAAASGLQGRFDNGVASRPIESWGAQQASYGQVEPSSVMPPRRAAPAGSSAAGAAGQWSASRGSSLQGVLQEWAGKAGVELLWYANSGYTLPKDINQGGTFESALQGLLQSYENNNNRPVGRLNTDPNSGRRVLVIETDRAL